MIKRIPHLFFMRGFHLSRLGDVVNMVKSWVYCTTQKSPPGTVLESNPHQQTPT